MRRLVLGLALFCGALQAAGPSAPPGRFDAAFVETRSIPGFTAPLVSHGRLQFDPAQGMRWEILQPYHYVFEMDGKQAHEELPDGTRRDLDPADTPWLAAVEHIFVSALSGDRSELESYFTVTSTPKAKGESVGLTPKPGPIANAISRIQVTESAPGRPEHLEIFEVSGGHMDIRFTPATTAP